MRAVLAPGLGEGLELAVGRVAAEFAKCVWIVFISARLSESCPGRLISTSSRSSASRRLHARRSSNSYGRPWPSRSNVSGPIDGLLDGVVGQHALDQPGQGDPPDRSTSNVLTVITLSTA